jgi:hypothetical protein
MIIQLLSQEYDMATNLKKIFKGKETKSEEMTEAKDLKKGKISEKQYVKGEKGEGEKASSKTLMAEAKRLKSGKESPAMYAKKGK